MALLMAAKDCQMFKKSWAFWPISSSVQTADKSEFEEVYKPFHFKNI